MFRKLFLLAAALVLTACTLGQAQENLTPTSPPGDVATAAVQTAMAQLTQDAAAASPVPSDTPPPSATSVPDSSDTPAPTITPTTPSAPCDLVGFVGDVTVPDGAEFAPGAAFTKTWRLRNDGSCTWDSSYQLVFDSGTRMGGPASQQLTTGTVAPGQTIDVSVALTAPSSSGTYRGNWKLRNAAGVLFGLAGNAPFYVEIEVVAAPNTPTPTTVPAPDLIINLLELDPSTPQKGHAVEVTVQVYNQGNAAAGPFTVAWWPGENYPAPACQWNIASLAAIGGRVLHCTYAGYPSHYPSIVTKAVADTTHSVAESNEGNNEAKMTIQVTSFLWDQFYLALWTPQRSYWWA